MIVAIIEHVTDPDRVVGVVIIVTCVLLIFYALALIAVHRHGRDGKLADAAMEAHVRETTASAGREKFK